MGASPSRITGSRPSSDILRFQCATADGSTPARPAASVCVIAPLAHASSNASRTPRGTGRRRTASRPPGAIARTHLSRDPTHPGYPNSRITSNARPPHDR